MAEQLYQRDHILLSSQLAQRLKISKKTLDRMIKDGRIPAPARMEQNNWRYWTQQDAIEIEETIRDEKNV